MKSREIRTTVQFLGIPVPDQPFPNVNDTPMMQKNIRFAQTFVFNNHNVIITSIVFVYFFPGQVFEGDGGRYLGCDCGCGWRCCLLCALRAFVQPRNVSWSEIK